MGLIISNKPNEKIDFFICFVPVDKMMLVYLICMLSTVTAKYTRSELQNMKALETERRTREFIDANLGMIERDVINYAKEGKTQYTIRFPGCDTVIRDYESEGATKEQCEYVINELKTRFANDFPDTDVLYDATGKYIIKWD